MTRALNRETTHSMNTEPLSPACEACTVPRGCFPGACKLYRAQPESLMLRKEGARLRRIIAETTAEADHIEALACRLESEGK